jgi:hypothetical protein
VKRAGPEPRFGVRSTPLAAGETRRSHDEVVGGGAHEGGPEVYVGLIGRATRRRRARAGSSARATTDGSAINAMARP